MEIDRNYGEGEEVQVKCPLCGNIGLKVNRVAVSKLREEKSPSRSAISYETVYRLKCGSCGQRSTIERTAIINPYKIKAEFE